MPRLFSAPSSRQCLPSTSLALALAPLTSAPRLTTRLSRWIIGDGVRYLSGFISFGTITLSFLHVAHWYFFWGRMNNDIMEGMRINWTKWRTRGWNEGLCIDANTLRAPVFLHVTWPRVVAFGFALYHLEMNHSCDMHRDKWTTRWVPRRTLWNLPDHYSISPSLERIKTSPDGCSGTTIISFASLIGLEILISLLSLSIVHKRGKKAKGERATWKAQRAGWLTFGTCLLYYID